MIFGRKNRSVAETEEVEDAFDDMESDFYAADVDPRHDGPFDLDEVELSEDGVERVAYGSLIITPVTGMDVVPVTDPASGTIYALRTVWENSGLELALFAAPTITGLAEELYEDIIEETEQAGGSCQVHDGPFGRELRRVLPIEGPEGEQLFHESRIWLVDGPRWLLRGILMGAAAMTENEEPPVDVFIEFFRNIVVKRDESPRVPGEIIALAPPEPEE